MIHGQFFNISDKGCKIESEVHDFRTGQIEAVKEPPDSVLGTMQEKYIEKIASILE